MPLSFTHTNKVVNNCLSHVLSVRIEKCSLSAFTEKGINLFQAAVFLENFLLLTCCVGDVCSNGRS